MHVLQRTHGSSRLAIKLSTTAVGFHFCGLYRCSYRLLSSPQLRYSLRHTSFYNTVSVLPSICALCLDLLDMGSAFHCKDISHAYCYKGKAESSSHTVSNIILTQVRIVDSTLLPVRVWLARLEPYCCCWKRTLALIRLLHQGLEQGTVYCNTACAWLLSKFGSTTTAILTSLIYKDIDIHGLNQS